MSAFELLHPALQYHVVNSLGWRSMRPAQLEAIAPIQAGRHCLVLAPTAGGKTEAAVIPVLSRMLAEDWGRTSTLYVCPIKALLNNLEPRLARYAAMVGRTVEVWHGDVSAGRKRAALRSPPDLLLTTPESLEGMLISPRVEREAWFGKLKVVIADELHAFAADDRGWHLRCVLHRIDCLLPQPMQRIGLSATVGNPEGLLEWFAPRGERQVVGSSAVSTDADVTIDHVGSIDNAATVVSRLYRGEKRLVFCDSRHAAERLGAGLNQRGVRTFVSHASLSASERRHAEAAFAEERDCVIVATSTLELGIDVGDLDRVIQIDAPATVSSFLQRMGRSGRRPDSRRNCLFLTLTDAGLLNALGVCRLWSQGWVEPAVAPAEPWNVVAQQAMLAIIEAGELPDHELLALVSPGLMDLPRASVASLVARLLEDGWLSRPGAGLLARGPALDKAYGARHFSELLATFSSPQLLLARHGSSDVGFLDPGVLAGQEPPAQVLLSGRSWQVQEVDWRRGTVWLEPAAGGGNARWMGAGRQTSASLAAAIRQCLLDEPVEAVKLSRRAMEAVSALQDAVPASDGAVQQLGATTFRMWMFAGSRANRARHLSWQGQGAFRSDGLGVDFRTDPRGCELPQPVCLLAPEQVRELARGHKFADLLPEALAEQMVRARLLG